MHRQTYYWHVRFLSALWFSVPNNPWVCLINDEMSKYARKNSVKDVFDFTCHVCRVYCWKVQLFNVNVEVWIRIYSHLRTAYGLTHSWLRTKRGEWFARKYVVCSAHSVRIIWTIYYIYWILQYVCMKQRSLQYVNEYEVNYFFIYSVFTDKVPTSLWYAVLTGV